MRQSKILNAPAWITLGWSLWTLLAANLIFMRPAACLNRWDEGYIAAFAGRMLDGQMLPYVDAVSQRGPLLYWLAAIAVGLGDRMSWMPIRVCALASMLITVTLTFLAARRAGRATAGAIAAIGAVAAFLLMVEPLDGLAFNGEHALNVFAAASLLCVTAALARARPSVWLVFAAGAAGAAGALCKQVGLSTLAPVGLWIACAAATRPGLTRRARWAIALSFAGGVIVPPLLTIARYAAAGELGTLWYWLYTYNAEVYMHPFPWPARIKAYRHFLGEHAGLAGLAAGGVAWGLTRPLLAARGVRDLARAYDEEGFTATVALGAAASIAAALSPMRFFLHYFVQVVPWCGLLAGLLLERGLEEGGRRRPLLARIVLLGACVLLVSFAWRERSRRLKDFARSPAMILDGVSPPVCEEIAARSKPGDALFVWGFQPDLYVTCQRRAASRYVFTSMVAGFAPFVPQPRKVEESLVVPGSRELLIADLERSRPPVIVDAPKSLGDRSMMQSIMLARYVREHYCRWKKVDDLSLFVRREPGEGCPDMPDVGALEGDYRPPVKAAPSIGPGDGANEPR
ncbi:MAG: glycosyltransferase family 39 protein [Polyangiaceae bacterium]|nr:glycosyltransferase family 39 protein [Polyangiaceae bacterium]